MSAPGPKQRLENGQGGKDNWRTPDDLFGLLNRTFGPCVPVPARAATQSPDVPLGLAKGAGGDPMSATSDTRRRFVCAACGYSFRITKNSTWVGEQW